jgi:hypothetical protein
LLSSARPSLCVLEALRWVVGGETMTTPGGTRTSCQSVPATPPCSAHRIYHGVGAPTSGPSFLPIVHGVVYSQILCPGPRPQGVSYVHVSGLGSYIRKQMPIRAPAGLSRVQSKPLPGRARTLHPPARPDLFSPNVGEEKFHEVHSSKVIEISFDLPHAPDPVRGFVCRGRHAGYTCGVDLLRPDTGCCVPTS